MPPLRSYPNSSYTIGWICSLPVEMAAAKGMLDEMHANPHTPPSHSDTNSYLLGRIHSHNVVIACLPRDEMGPASAALVASHMLGTFPRIEVGLSVGTGSGIPHWSPDTGDVKDIRLGDVVVASDAKTGGVVAYSSGKWHDDGSFEVINAMGRPPRALRAALSRFEVERMWGNSGIGENIAGMLERYPALRRGGFTYPKEVEDVLFEVEDRQVGGKTSRVCDGNRNAVRDRPVRLDTEPVVHFGVIASGSEIVSHAPTRERIREEYGAICVDTQAAGIMNYFPCLVIRGISDYADSHKNDRWEAYAAATAAACAKELLEYVPVKGDQSQNPQDATRPAPIPQTNSEETFSSTDVTAVAPQEGNPPSTILSWIAELELLAQQNYRIERGERSIAMSMLQYHTLQRWVGQPRQSQMIPYVGPIGSGIAYRLLDQYLYSSRRDRDGRGSLAPVIASVKQRIWSGLWAGFGAYESKGIE